MAKAATPVEENKVPAKVMMGGFALPDHLRDQAKTTRVGNVDSTDLIIPRVKLIQKISPEIDTFPDLAKPGRFFHNVANADMGPELHGIPIVLRKTYVLWAPRQDDRGILARASDGVNWDVPNLEFEVKPKGSPNNVKYKLGVSVHDKTGDGPALSAFGSSIPGDPQSPPAASLTYEMLWFFPDFPQFSPSIILNTRSQVKPAQGLLTKIDMIPVDHYYAKFLIGSVQENGAEGPYFNITYTMAGFATKEEGEITKAMYERFKTLSFRANDESENDMDKAAATGGRPRGSGPSDSDKF